MATQAEAHAKPTDGMFAMFQQWLSSSAAGAQALKKRGGSERSSEAVDRAVVQRGSLKGGNREDVNLDVKLGGRLRSCSTTPRSKKARAKAASPKTEDATTMMKKKKIRFLRVAPW